MKRGASSRHSCDTQKGHSAAETLCRQRWPESYPTQLARVCSQRRAGRPDSSTGLSQDQSSPRCAAPPCHPRRQRSLSPRLFLLPWQHWVKELRRHELRQVGLQVDLFIDFIHLFAHLLKHLVQKLCGLLSKKRISQKLNLKLLIFFSVSFFSCLPISINNSLEHRDKLEHITFSFKT